jgi:hypothetical protein
MQLFKAVSAATNRDVLVWSRPGSATAQAGRSPLRMLLGFLPPIEGGIERTDRLSRLQGRAMPRMTVRQALAAMRLVDDLPPAAVDVLFQYCNLLFIKYVREPHLALVAGHPDRAFKRLEWVRSVLEEMDFAAVPEAELGRKVAEWRQQVRAVYLALLVTKDPGAQERVNRLWAEDNFLLALMGAKDRPDPKRHEKRSLTTIVLTATKDSLGEATHYLSALCWHEQAVRAQAAMNFSRKKGKEGQRAADKAKSQWINARGWWEKYIERYSVKNLPQRLEALRAIEGRNDYHIGRGQRDALTGQVQRTLAAQMFLADAQQFLQQDDPARATLLQLRKDLIAIREDSGWAQDVAALLDKLGGRGEITVQNALLNAALDLGPDGSFAWMQRTVEERLADK